MVRKRNLLITLVLCLAIVSFSINAVCASVSPPFEFVTPWVWDGSPNLTIESPTVNGTYTGTVMLNFTVEKSSYWFNNQSGNWDDFNLKNTAIEQKLKSVTYVLDGYLTTIPVDSNLCLPYKGSVELANLTEGTHQLIVYTNATGVYRSFRGFFAQIQVNDSNKTAIVFNFAPTPTPSPTIAPASQIVQILNIGIVLVIVIVVIGCLLVVRRHRKPISQNKPNV